MAVAVEVEDDVFFADLSRQISLLIMDDEQDSSVSPSKVSVQYFSQGIHPMMHASMFVQEQNYVKRESKGTGVFIPQLTNSRRKNSNRQQAKHGSSSSNNSKFHRQFDNSTRGSLQHVPYNNDNSSYDSLSSRRFK